MKRPLGRPLIEVLLEDGDARSANTSEADMETFLADMFYTANHTQGGSGDISAPADVRTYRESGVMTNNKGLVVRLEDGSEFQIQIVKSR